MLSSINENVVRNNTLLTDFYELTMANGYFELGKQNEIAYFDMFFRKVPDEGGFAIMAGLEQLIKYMMNLKFTEEDISFLKSKGCFSDAFLEYLRNFKFECDVWAIPEGTPVFPGEPLVTVRGPIIQAQLIETFLLLTINHQTLIATKTNRIVRAAQGRSVMEFGTRRAQGSSAAMLGARAAYIGGAVGTACTMAEREFGIPALGTMAHSWVQTFDSEYEAFSKFAELYPDNCVLLVDTYDVIKSGMPNAIRVFKEKKPSKMGVRIDSGDMTYLSRIARKMLDDEGLQDCSIVASNSFDEYIIRGVVNEGACIDSFGVGERLITAKSQPVFGGVYKMAAIEKDGKIIPKIKVSENPEKLTNPGYKKLYRIVDKNTGKALADVIALADEKVPEGEPFEIFDPEHIWKRKLMENYECQELQVRIFDKGNLVYDMPSLEDIKAFCKDEIEILWSEIKRFENPHRYYVDLSSELWHLKQNLLSKHSRVNKEE
ncbi:MAG: nicotinate phosphoribosyltransferase [Firmicutes bacterium]|nr:nicotinate phosphoribosyltransferase [Bacillota bacterium]